MATISSSFLQTPNQQSPHLFKSNQISTKRAVFFKIQAAKLPAGVNIFIFFNTSIPTRDEHFVSGTSIGMGTKLIPTKHYRYSFFKFSVSVVFNDTGIDRYQTEKSVELPKSQPKFQAPFLGFTKTAEIWNSRACMIGLIGTFIVELILNKGILEIIGVEIGKGLDIPL